MANSLSSSIVVSNVLYLKASSEGYPDDRSEVGRQQFVSSQWKPSASPALNCTSQQQSHKIDPQFPSPPLSPRSSSPPSEDWFRRGLAPQQGPPNDSLRPDLLAVCKAFETQMQDMQRELDPRFHEQSEQVLPWVDTRSGYESGSVPVFVMLPLDTVRVNNTVHRKRAMDVSLRALKTAGVEGVMVDVWWGIVEREAPGQYNWSGYRDLLEMVRRHELKVQTVMSFHRCGGNVGDSVNIPLPKWVVEEIDRDNDLAYSDQWGRRNYEYVSLGCDDLPVLKGRTPVQCYADYMRSFKENFKDLIGETIVEIQIGMGPAGELRYPSYPESNGTWKFSGTGAFQCYDKYMLANLKAKAETAGKEEWGYGGPTDAGNYNSWPEDTDFFHSEGGWNSPYGDFFLQWYSGMLLDHGERILAAGESIFRGTGARLSGKVAGIHWHYGTRSHAAELTAGYYNTQLRDGYLPIATLFARHGVVFNFTCIEMKDVERPENAKCFPEKLIKQVIRATRKAWVALSGENALPRFDESALQQIINNSSLRLEEDNADDKVEPMCAFTYLRMSEHLFQRDNWIRFVSFVRKMSRGVTTSNSCNEKHRGTRPLIKGATS